MNKLIISALVAIIILVGGFFWLNSYIYDEKQGDATPTPTAATKDDLIVVTSLKANDTVRSPLVVKGRARGTWYFEASFPLALYDAEGRELVKGYAMTSENWMTTEFVSFESIPLQFGTPKTETGVLVLSKDNPSGLPQYDDELRIPVRFDLSGIPQRTVKLYYYNPAKDQGPGGVQCSRAGLEAVERSVPVTTTPIQDAIRLLLKGELTVDERARGITSEFPLPGVELAGAVLKNGVLTLEFKDPQNKTGGGSCRVGILWFQIEATAKQFSGVTSVRFIPEELFQP